MPVFEFHNRWVNLRFQPVETNTDTASGNDGPSLSKEGQILDTPVLSGYFWLYLALTVHLPYRRHYHWVVVVYQRKRHKCRDYSPSSKRSK